MTPDLFDDGREARYATSEMRVELRREIEAIRAEAEIARTKYNSLEWLHDALEALRIIQDRIERYDPTEDRPEAGIMLLGEIKCALMSIFGQLQPMEEVQDLQVRLADLQPQPGDSSLDGDEA